MRYDDDAFPDLLAALTVASDRRQTVATPRGRLLLCDRLYVVCPAAVGTHAEPICRTNNCATDYSGLTRDQDQARPIKAKFHYTSWFGAGSQPASVMEFGR